MSIYNVRVYHYPETTQYRVYKNPVYKDDKKNTASLFNLDDFIYTGLSFDETVEEYSEFHFPYVKKYVIDDDVEILPIDENIEKKSERAQKVASNRAKQNVYALARANVWDWFLTFTFDREKVDSSNYDLTLKKIRKWLNNQQQRYAPDLKYLIVPELHKDGIHYHFHGLLANCEKMKFVDSGITKKGKKIYNLESFKFGFTTASKVTDSKKVSSYIVKYITKDLSKSLFGHHRYLASKNLDKPIVEELNLMPEEIQQIYLNIPNESYIQNKSSDYQYVTYIDFNNSNGNLS